MDIPDTSDMQKKLSCIIADCGIADFGIDKDGCYLGLIDGWHAISRPFQQYYNQVRTRGG